MCVIVYQVLNNSMSEKVIYIFKHVVFLKRIRGMFYFEGIFQYNLHVHLLNNCGGEALWWRYSCFLRLSLSPSRPPC